MKMMPLERRNISGSRIALGCMGLGGAWDSSPITDGHVLEAERAIDAALEAGITFFDHADIYTRGKAEKVFGQVLRGKPALRDRIVLQSKCGIRFAEDTVPGRYDFSKDHILSSVDQILQRLGTERLDILLLHRPDPLMEPEVVSEAFLALHKSGKVLNFGVSNMNQHQMKLIETYMGMPLIVNQLEMSLHKLDWVNSGVHVNQKAGAFDQFPEGLIEHCMMSDVQIQAWSPLAKGIYSGNDSLLKTEADRKTKALVEQMAAEKETSMEAIVLGWMMRHPAKIQPVVGTVNPERILNCADAVRIAETMTREEWYSLYVSARGNILP